MATIDAEAARAKWPDAPDTGRMMGRSILKTRFGLVVHQETREMPVFALVLASNDRKLGPQFTRSTLDCVPERTTGRPRSADPRCGGRLSPGRLMVRGMTMTKIAEAFALLSNTNSSLNRLVVDGTGLEGSYDMDLTYTPDIMPPAGAGPPSAIMPPIDPNAPSIFAEVQEQLGLKLEPRRGPADVLVVDPIERPSAD